MEQGFSYSCENPAEQNAKGRWQEHGEKRPFV